MAVKFKIQLSSEELEQLDQMIQSLKMPAAGNLKKLITVWNYMEMAKKNELPIYAEFDRLHVLNDAALEEVRRIGEPVREMENSREKEILEQKQSQMEKASKAASEFYDALELKPGVFGFRVDLKKLWEMVAPKRGKEKRLPRQTAGKAAPKKPANKSVSKPPTKSETHRRDTSKKQP